MDRLLKITGHEFLTREEDAAGIDCVADKIEAIVAATSEGAFLKDEVLTAAVLHHLTVIGEAISRLTVDLRNRHAEVPWPQIIAVRHRIVHAYFDLDRQILWDAATGDIPDLRMQILSILKTEFAESDAD